MSLRLAIRQGHAFALRTFALPGERGSYHFFFDGSHLSFMLPLHLDQLRVNLWPMRRLLRQSVSHARFHALHKEVGK